MTKLTDVGIEQMVATLLRAGVMISGTIVLAAGAYYVIRSGTDPVHLSTFVGEPSRLRVLHEIMESAWHRQPRAAIQVGVLFLVATPVLRVILSLVAFALEGDRRYVVITAIVLAVLLFGLAEGIG